eukprot:CAMPEP_0171460904 /NCGR_PEP_ID=MMETSP0945-20130129/5584_1 /TAXON_ID=109269 /ORGANISM="Vaucheria litorea, Strain CCMP2940" /LENGTH=599 /DNA_ID=CAMNT_0011987181 /DNA_START=196 /DNA_END=1995 /DNA_ORIENTATION=-
MNDKKVDPTVVRIQRMEQARAERRLNASTNRQLRAQKEKRNIAKGNPGDIDFQLLIDEYRNARSNTGQPHYLDPLTICIAVRKRPISEKERGNKDHDSVSVFNPKVTAHMCKTRVDGLSKYLDNGEFQFDHTFNDMDTTEDIYLSTCRNLIPFVMEGGRATVFAYGQTGSGKTYTMVGIQQLSIIDMFELLERSPYYSSSLEVCVSFYEIYGGKCQDLLNSRERLVVREDGRKEVHIVGLKEVSAQSSHQVQLLIDKGNRNRTTHSTEANSVSSRSHAICQIILRNRNTNVVHGKLSLIDLAGSERGSETKSSDPQRRLEGAEINKSLLALKECIRSIDSGDPHVPYRASKLTLVLKDSFTRPETRTVMIATVSPGASHADHTINTLRYANRVKQIKVMEFEAASVSEHEEIVSDVVPEDNKGKRNNSVSPDHQAPSSSISMPEFTESNDEFNGYWHEHTSTEDFDEDTLVHGMKNIELSVNCNSGMSSREREMRIQEAKDRKVKRIFESLYKEENALTALHMKTVKEVARLLEEEGKLILSVNGQDVVDYDIDSYAERMSQIVNRKISLYSYLKFRLEAYKTRMENEEVRVGRILQSI